MNLKTTLLAGALTLSTATLSHTQDAGGHSQYFYVGGGSGDDGSAFSVGYFMPTSTDDVWGFDFAMEGSHTFTSIGIPFVTRTTTRQERSFSGNWMYGSKIHDEEDSDVYALGLLGIRGDNSQCLGSTLGHRCFGNIEPDTEYKLNYGVMAIYALPTWSIGLRITGESTQLLGGYSF